jgi:hypothetical protein
MMTMSNILCIDPGGTTGVAIFTVFKNRQPELLRHIEVPNGTKGFIDFYRQNQSIYKWTKIVCESFTLRIGVKFPDLTPVYIIGALEALVEDPTEIIFQSPSLKSLCDDDRLKSISMHQRGNGHANDAIRHGIIYLRNTKHMPTIEMTWPRED